MEAPPKPTSAYGVPSADHAFTARRIEYEAVSTLALVNALLRRRMLVIGLPLLCVIGVAVYQLFQPRTYISSAAFAPQSNDARSRLTGMAAQLGLALPTADAAQSPAFYVELATSREILDSLVATTYTVASNGRPHSGTLAEFLDVDEKDASKRMEETLKRLKKAISATKSHETPIVTVSVSTHWPDLSRQVLEHLLRSLDEFNLNTRQTTARSERKFVEQRLQQSAQELASAENAQRDFLRQNRAYQRSPDLNLEYERLQRTISFRQQVYSVVAQNFEQARADEVRDTPVVTVISHPNEPARPASRKLLVKTLVPAGVALVLITLGVIGEALVQRRVIDGRTDVDEFVELRQATWDDLRHPWRAVGRLFRRTPAGASMKQ